MHGHLGKADKVQGLCILRVCVHVYLGGVGMMAGAMACHSLVWTGAIIRSGVEFQPCILSVQHFYHHILAYVEGEGTRLMHLAGLLDG